MACINTISTAEEVQDGRSFGCQLPDSTLSHKYGVGLRLGRLNQSGVDETLTHGASHFFGHGEGRRGRRDDPSRGILGVRYAVRLRELEGAKVGNGFLGKKRFLHAREPHSVRSERKASDESGEQVLEVSGKGPFVVGHA